MSYKKITGKGVKCMSIIVDIVILAILLLCIIIGYVRGLTGSLIKILSFVLSIVIAFILFVPISNLIINNTQIDESLQGTIETKLEKVVGNEETDGITNSLIENAKNGAVEETAKSLSINIIYGVTIILLFIILRIALVFITAIANWIAKLPILKQANKAGGIIYGLLRGLLIAYALLLIINLVITLNPQGALSEVLNETYLAKAMMEYNILNIFF